MASHHATKLRDLGRKFRASMSLTPEPSFTSPESNSSSGSVAAAGSTAQGLSPIDPANHRFDPPLPSIDKVHGCERCNLMVALMYWRRDYVSGNRDHSDDQPYILYRTRQDLGNGVRHRCWWCLRLETSLANVEKGRNANEPESGRGIFITFRLTKQETTFAVHVRTWRNVGLPWFRVKMFSDVNWIPKHLREPPANIGNYTGGPPTWKYVRDRLENCARTHSDCQNPNSWVPTRLLEVMTTGSATQLRVVFTENWAKKPRYISLSHQWGPNPSKTIQLTRETYRAYQGRVPMENLPRKYLDAIQAARQLGVQYLWIDSLCIIQDDEMDWERESAQMHRVYRYGFCNLSAASARPENDEGLFYDRDAVWVKPHVIIPRNNNTDNMKSLEITQYEFDNEWFARLDREPLYGRGWVCQERLLSTRNVSFARHLVYFECASEISSDVSGGSGGWGRGDSMRSKRSDEKLFSLRTLGMSESSMPPQMAWQQIVEFYSTCKLTVPTDKLVAIGGIARAFHERTGSKYVAGLWTDSLLQGLAWQRFWPGLRRSPRVKYSEYIAPSWSWMSHNGPVAHAPVYERHAYAECDEVSTVPYGTDSFGRIRSGTLRLRCYAVPLVLVKQQGEDGGRLYSKDGKGDLQDALEMAVRSFVPTSAPKDLVMECWLDDDTMRVSEGDVPSSPTMRAKYYAVPLYSEIGSTTCNTPFLLLEPVRPQVWGKYRRVGLGSFRDIGPYLPPPDGDAEKEDGVRDMPVVCRKGWSLGVPLPLCRSLANMLRAAERAPEDMLPAHERTGDGRCLITVV
ncbi:HET-domain-containing protein [Apiospora arundinis]|uniref:HET-domain-containing protein n=1 Tax=Apiospora arundinis TaxID=335852 RepID=A0ABR2HLE1_9PEZI